jgi:hypothetical protein
LSDFNHALFLKPFSIENINNNEGFTNLPGAGQEMCSQNASNITTINTSKMVVIFVAKTRLGRVSRLLASTMFD